MRTLPEMIAALPEGLTLAEIAARTGKPIPTVRARIWQMRNPERTRAMQRAYYRRCAEMSVKHSVRDWSAEDDALLEQLWPTTSAAQIGVRMKRSKNAVIGRVHRLGLSKGGAA